MQVLLLPVNSKSKVAIPICLTRNDDPEVAKMVVPIQGFSTGAVDKMRKCETCGYYEDFLEVRRLLR
jgi:hypothetical protein